MLELFVAVCAFLVGFFLGMFFVLDAVMSGRLDIVKTKMWEGDF